LAERGINIHLSNNEYLGGAGSFKDHLKWPGFD
jgi:hypothetical protein